MEKELNELIKEMEEIIEETEKEDDPETSSEQDHAYNEGRIDALQYAINNIKLILNK